MIRSLPRRLLLSATMLVVAILAAHPVAPPSTSAHWGACVSDPKVWLSNGDKVEIGATVDQAPAAVTHVSFVLHVPAGVTMTQLVRTAGVDESFESVSVVPDLASGYAVSADVATIGNAGDPATLTAHVVSQGSTWASTSGLTSSNLAVSLTNG